MASVIHAIAHGLVASDPFRFANVLPTDSGVDESVIYYVLPGGLTADDFTFSETDGGAAFVLTNPITSGVLLSGDTYTVVDNIVMNPPDPTGLTFEDGVIGGSAWSEFVALGLHNADFNLGTLGTIPLGRTEALPHWEVIDVNAGAALTLVDSVSSPGEQYLKTMFGATSDKKRIVSDWVPCNIAQPVVYGVLTQGRRDAGTLTITVGIEFSDDKVSTISGTDATLVINTGVGTYAAQNVEEVSFTAGHWARLIIDTEQTVAHDADNFIGIFTAWLRPAPTRAASFRAESIQARNDGLSGFPIMHVADDNTLAFGGASGALSDVAMRRSAASVLSITDEDLNDDATLEASKLRATTTGDVSLASTGHGLQVGPTSGVNIAVDGNEIQARNNGAANTLNLNIEGGDIALGAEAVFDDTTGEFSEYSSNDMTSYAVTVGGMGSGTNSTATGYYVKLGKIVFIKIYLVCNANGTGAGNITITTPSSPDRTTRQTLHANVEGHTINGSFQLVALTGGSGAVWDRLRSSTGANMIGTDYDNGGIITIQGWYLEA
jgi:hypothetical protein